MSSKKYKNCIIDVHSHIIPEAYLEGLDRFGIDPIKTDGFPTPVYSIGMHLDFMDRMGIGRSVLSVSSPQLLCGNAKETGNWTRRINEETAETCMAHKDRFVFSATLPVPYIDASIKEADYALNTLGAVSVKLPTNADGVYLGDGRFDPLFEYLNEKNTVVILHPVCPPVRPEGVFTSKVLPLMEFLADTTRTVLNMLANDTLERYPNIRMIVPHSGAFLPNLKHRTLGIMKALDPGSEDRRRSVEKAFDSLYYDIAGTAVPVAYDALLKITGPGHILYGSDFPYTPTAQIINGYQSLMERETFRPYREAILHRNAEELFGI